MINTNSDFIKSMTSGGMVHIKIELYDSKMNYIKEITQSVTADIGSMAVNSDSPIRRSLSLSLDNTLGEFIFGENNLIWIDKRLKIFLGLSTWNGNLEYIQLGVFLLTEPTDSHGLDGKKATINCVDKAYLMTGNRGKFVNEQVISAGANVASAIRTISAYIGETMFNFDDVNAVVPYELTYGGEDNRWNAIQEMAELAKCTVFYDVYGYLRLKKIDLNAFDNEPITWEYKAGDSFYAGNSRKFNDGNLFNDIVVLGGNGDTATTSYRLTVDETKPLWANHPYSVQKIGHSTFFWNNNSPDPLLAGSIDSCKWRAKFELMNRLGFAEEVQISLSPNYLHDVDDVIWLEDKENGIQGNKYLIRSINLPLSPSTMTMDIVRYRKVIDDWDFI